MNREIKFRALDDGKMIYSHNNSINTNNFQLKWFFEKIRQDAIVMQFIGLKDELGVDIYEGDILEFPFEMGIAYVINDGFRFAVKSPGSEAVDYEGESVLKCTRIIGNIYDNPNLLQ